MKKKQEDVILFDRRKYIIVIAGLVITALGFLLMIGGGSENPNEFSYELFSTRRITIAPILVIAGYAVQIYAILKRTSNQPENTRNK